jgi:outer membrane protein assembly factor BamB
MDGNLFFEYDFKTAVEASPLIVDTVLYIGRIDGYMTALSLSQKEVLWTFETWGQLKASANYTDFGGRQAIIFGSYDHYLYIIDAQDGEEITRYESDNYINGTVALMNDYVIFGGCDSWLRIIDSKTGLATDSLDVENYIPSSAAVMGDYAYVIDYSGNVTQLQIENGKIINHNIILEEIANEVSVPSVCSENLYVLTSNQYLYSIKQKDGSINWRYLMKGDAGESSPVICRDRVILCTRSGIVSIINADTGELEWEYDTGEQITASPAVIKDRFYILTNRGTLFCFGK